MEQQQTFNPNAFRLTGTEQIEQAVEQYSGTSAEFFQLKNDKDTDKVVFLHGDSNDLDIFTVHKVNIGGKDRYVACLSPQNIPCPFCSHGHKPTVRAFISLRSLSDGKKKLWDRGKNEIATILSRITKYGPLNQRVYEITRKGKNGDSKTTYDILPDGDPTDTSALFNDRDLTRQEIIGPDKFVLVKTVSEMEALVAQGCLTATSSYGYAPQAPTTGYAPVPQPGYTPQGGYVPPQTGYAPPQGGYAPPQGGYVPPQQPQAPQGGSVTVGYASQPPSQHQTYQAPTNGASQTGTNQGANYFTPNAPNPTPTPGQGNNYQL